MSIATCPADVYRETIAAALAYAADPGERPAFRLAMAATARTNLELLAGARGWRPGSGDAATALAAYQAACARVGA